MCGVRNRKSVCAACTGRPVELDLPCARQQGQNLLELIAYPVIKTVPTAMVSALVRLTKDLKEPGMRSRMQEQRPRKGEAWDKELRPMRMSM